MDMVYIKRTSNKEEKPGRVSVEYFEKHAKAKGFRIVNKDGSELSAAAKKETDSK